MSPTGHSVLSPSSAARWMRCPPSARLNAEMPDASGEAAKEGTAAHALGEYKVRSFLGEKLRRPKSDYENDDMEQATDDYLLFIREKIADARQKGGEPSVFLEMNVDLKTYIPHGYGQTDCCIATEGTLYIIDLKYGGLLVEAENNEQLMIYALGCMEQLSLLYDFKEVSLSIFQPRRQNISEWTIKADALKEWGEKVLKPAAEKAFDGLGDMNPGVWCRFCKVAPKCRARAEDCLALARMDFREAATLSDDELAEVLGKAEKLSAWAEEVKAYCEEQAVTAGRKYPGYKLVMSRSKRVFTDTKAVEKAALKAGLEESDIYTKSLLSLTGFEKLLGKERFNTVLGAYIGKTEPHPTLVPESDRREEVNVSTAEDDFKGEES